MKKRNDNNKKIPSCLFRGYRNEDHSILSRMIKDLYKEDPGPVRMTDIKIENTICELNKEPGKGGIIIFQWNNEVIGYAILVNFWSNEYGGNIVILDELYVREEYRGKGAGTFFLKYLKKTEQSRSAGILLEVRKTNKKAYRLYKRHGFEDDLSRFMLLKFK